MDASGEAGIWKRIGDKFKAFREELQKDSVAANPRKPVDCCNPPVALKTEQKLKK
jgi:hypothetical protein